MLLNILSRNKINLKILMYNLNYGGCLKMLMKRSLKELMQPKFKGNTLTIELSDFGYENYFVECAFHFDKQKDKYSLSMWLNRNDIEDRMRLSSKKVDTQYIPGTKETIVEYICHIVHQAATVADEDGIRYFDPFVERYEYELKCFDRGNELFEQERLAG